MNELNNIDPDKIYYDSNAKFLIIPELKKDDENLLTGYLKLINDRSNNCYFWTYDQQTCSIIVNEYIESTDYDIFNQFTALTTWLFSRNYDLKGSFFCRYGKFIEYITTDGKNKVISHNILFDFNSKNNINLTNNQLDDENIINQAKNRINEYKKNIKLEKTKKISAILEEHSVIITEMQKRLIVSENKLKSLGEMNKSLWRLCTIITLVTVGSIIYHMFWDNEIGNTL